MKSFVPTFGTFHLKSRTYEGRITIDGITATEFRTTEPYVYDIEEFNNWLTRRGVTITKEETQ